MSGSAESLQPKPDQSRRNQSPRSAAVVPARTPRRITVLLPIVALILVALCGLFLFGLATAQVGVLGLMIGVVAALVPVGAVVATFLWIDRWEPEPAKFLLLGFVWGACVAALTALLINNTAEAVGELLLGSGNGSKFSAIVSAPVVEEAAKALFVILLLWWKSNEFDGVIDGIVYAGFSAAGFAFTENIYYFGHAFSEYGFGTGTSAGVLAAFVLRGVLSPFTHPLFTVLTGIGIGLASQTKSRAVKIFAPLGGYLIAVALHALWNASALLGGAKIFINVYFLVMVPVFVGVLLLVLWHRRREQRIIAAALPEMAAARWIAASEVSLLGNLSARRQWRKQASKQSGRQAARAVALYQASVTELAFLRRGLVHDEADGVTATQRHQQLLAALRGARSEAVRLANGGKRNAVQTEAQHG